jgi:hypothetical protein
VVAVVVDSAAAPKMYRALYRLVVVEVAAGAEEPAVMRVMGELATAVVILLIQVLMDLAAVVPVVEINYLPLMVPVVAQAYTGKAVMVLTQAVADLEVPLLHLLLLENMEVVEHTAAEQV